MTLPTHLAFAFVSVLYLGGAVRLSARPGRLGASGRCQLVAGGGFADVESRAAVRVRVSVPLERRFGHRTLTHSTVAWRWPAVSIKPTRITCWGNWRWPTPCPGPQRPPVGHRDPQPRVLPGRGSDLALRPRPGTGAVAELRRRPGRGDRAVLAPARRGEAAVTLGPGEEREVERIPARLRRFLGSTRDCSIVSPFRSGQSEPKRQLKWLF